MAKQKWFKSKKAQFFIISAFTIVSILYFISKWMEPYTIIDTSSIASMDEPFIFNNLVDKIKETIKISKDYYELEYNLQEFESFAKQYGITRNFFINLSIPNISAIAEKNKQITPIDVVLIIDISGSMEGQTSNTCKERCNSFGSRTCIPSGGCTCPNCNDCDANGHNADPYESPCSINDAKNASITFVNLLNSSRDRAGLVAFNDTTNVFHSLSSNYVSVNNSIGGLNGGGSTRIGNAIDNATQMLNTTGRANANWYEILLSDGKDVPCCTNMTGAASRAAGNHTVIYTIGLGDPSYLDVENLTKVADITGGKYFSAPDSTQLQDIYREIAKEILNIKADIPFCVNLTSTSVKLWGCGSETFRQT